MPSPPVAAGGLVEALGEALGETDADGLDAGGLAIALEQVTMAYRAKLEQLKRIDEAQRRGAN